MKSWQKAKKALKSLRSSYSDSFAVLSIPTIASIVRAYRDWLSSVISLLILKRSIKFSELFTDDMTAGVFPILIDEFYKSYFGKSLAGSCIRNQIFKSFLNRNKDRFTSLTYVCEEQGWESLLVQNWQVLCNGKAIQGYRHAAFKQWDFRVASAIGTSRLANTSLSVRGLNCVTALSYYERFPVHTKKILAGRYMRLKELSVSEEVKPSKPILLVILSISSETSSRLLRTLDKAKGVDDCYSIIVRIHPAAEYPSIGLLRKNIQLSTSAALEADLCKASVVFSSDDTASIIESLYSKITTVVLRPNDFPTTCPIENSMHLHLIDSSEDLEYVLSQSKAGSPSLPISDEANTYFFLK